MKEEFFCEPNDNSNKEKAKDENFLFQNDRRELFAQRQAFLEEMKALKFRESENQRNIELRERFGEQKDLSIEFDDFRFCRSLFSENERLKRLEDEIRKREAAVTHTELRIAEEVQLQLKK